MARPATTPVTKADEPPRPLPAGASESMSISIPHGTPIRWIAAFARSITPSYTGPASKWYSTRCPRSRERTITWRSSRGAIVTRT